jgi:Ni,Fe-hydrogenase maturation factor
VNVFKVFLIDSYMKILVFGNPLVKQDNLALRLIPWLQKEFPHDDFKEFDPTENLEAEIENGKLAILDVAEGIEKVIVIEDIDKLELIKSCSMHDCDLAFNLKLLKKIGKLKGVKIIGLPMEMSEEIAIKEVRAILGPSPVRK